MLKRREICHICGTSTYVSPDGRFGRHSPGLGGRFYKGSYYPTWCFGSKQEAPQAYELLLSTKETSFADFLATLAEVMEREA